MSPQRHQLAFSPQRSEPQPWGSSTQLLASNNLRLFPCSLSPSWLLLAVPCDVLVLTFYPFSFLMAVFYTKYILLKYLVWGLPWWRSGWESACQCRGHGFEPWSGKIPRAAEQLGPWATTTEPARLEPVLRKKRGRDSERPAHRDEEWPPLAATGESPHTETKTQHSHK